MKKCIIKASGSVIKDNYRSGCFLHNRHFRHGHLLKMILNVAFVFVIRELMEFEGKLPPVSDESDLELQEGDVVRNISVNIRFQDGWDE